MMLSWQYQKEQSCGSRTSQSLATPWFFLSFEFLMGIALSLLFWILAILKSLLPKPPRDLTGDVVLITGACSSLGESLSEEFAQAGCSVVCVDESRSATEGLASRLSAEFPRIAETERRGWKADEAARRCEPRTARSYSCDLRNRNEIRELAGKVKDEVGRVDVLVTCTGKPHEDIFDTAGGTLMSHYWTVLAFLPSMLNNDRAHVVGIMPCTSAEDGYMGSRAAIAGLMECLGEEFGGRDSRVTFLTAVPKTDRRTRRLSEWQIARDVVQAVQRDQSSLTVGWSSRAFYRVSRALYTAITAVQRWFFSAGCDDPF